jgi:hypothetical protein
LIGVQHHHRMNFALPRAIDFNGRTIWIADAHRGDRKRFVVRADEKVTAFWSLKESRAKQLICNFKREFLRGFSPACAPLRTLRISTISDSRCVAQNCALLQPKILRP